MNHPMDIAYSLHKITHEDEKQLTEALYQLKAIAENKYNSEYWLVLYKALSDIAEKDLLPF